MGKQGTGPRQGPGKNQDKGKTQNPDEWLSKGVARALDRGIPDTLDPERTGQPGGRARPGGRERQ